MSRNRVDEKIKPSPAPTEKTVSNINSNNLDKPNIPQSPKKSTASDGRYRQWTIVVYPESAPDNWRDLLIGLIWIESPLHDKDLNPDGTPKKPHWHIFISFDGKKSYEQVKEIADSVCGASPQYVQNAVGMVRYFAHLDNPEKAQYDPKGIIGHGVDPKQYIESTADYDRLMIEITQFVRENHITEYADLCYETLDLMESHPDWFKCVSTHTIHFKALVSSQRHRPMPTQKAEDDVSAIVDECVKEGGGRGETSFPRVACPPEPRTESYSSRSRRIRCSELHFIRYR